MCIRDRGYVPQEAFIFDGSIAQNISLTKPDASLEEIKESLIYWYAKTKRKVTFEYIVWKDINDSIEHITALIKFCKSIPSKVNLIEYNSIGDENFKSASENMINLYKGLLEKNKITVTVRRSRGKDIEAACGQLANK